MLCIITCLSYAFSKLMFFLFFIGNFDIFYCSNYFLSFYYCRFYLFCITISSKLHQPHLVSSQFITNVSLHNNILEYIGRTKYLGFKFNLNGQDDEDMLRQIRKLYIYVQTSYYVLFIIVLLM